MSERDQWVCRVCWVTSGIRCSMWRRFLRNCLDGWIFAGWESQAIRTIGKFWYNIELIRAIIKRIEKDSNYNCNQENIIKENERAWTRIS